jgi:hypothetical protein
MGFKPEIIIVLKIHWREDYRIIKNIKKIPKNLQPPSLRFFPPLFFALIIPQPSVLSPLWDIFCSLLFFSHAHRLLPLRISLRLASPPRAPG